MAKVLDHYIKEGIELRNKYGDNSIVLHQFGAFYEIWCWDIKCKDDGVKGEKSKELKLNDYEKISRITGLNVGKFNNKKEHSFENPFKMGFLKPFLGPYLSDLVNAGYVVAIYDEVDVPNQKHKDRVLTRIETPSTLIEENNKTNIFMGIEIHTYNCRLTKTKSKYAVIVVLNVSNGNVNIYPVINSIDDDRISSEITRLLYTYNPSEVHLLETNRKQSENSKKSSFLEKSILEPFNFKLIDSFCKEYYKPSYQSTFLQKIYKELGVDNVLKNMELFSKAIPCFIYSLQYIFETNPQILKNIKPPIFDNDGQFCKLGGDSIIQLHIEELAKFFNITFTNMGSRLIRSRLLFPITDVDLINKRYDEVDFFMKNITHDQFSFIKEIGDFEKKCKKWSMGNMTPKEFGTWNNCFSTILKFIDAILDVLENHDLEYNDNVKIYDIEKIHKWKNRMTQFYENYISTFNIDQLVNTDVESMRSFFNPGKNQVLDELDSKVKNIKNTIKKIAEDFPIDVTISFNKKTGYAFKTSPKKFATLKSCLKSHCDKDSDLLMKFCYKGKKFKIYHHELVTRNLKTTVEFTFRHLQKFNDTVLNLWQNMSTTMMKQYKIVTEKYYRKYHRTFNKLCKLVAQVDATSAIAHLSKYNGYVRPDIIEKEYGFVNAKKLRHPVLEKTTPSEYIPNDIIIGRNKKGEKGKKGENNKGHIIYGVNASGKSCFVRSVGISIIMAQAGMFVAAKRFTFSPFSSIFAKMSIHDCPLKNQSTFQVELESVRAILNNAGPKTCVLTDELFSSTETLSAISLVAATLLRLAEKSSTFIFATHLHHLQFIPEIKESNKINIFHIDIEVQDGQVIYKRELKPGGIDSLYGIESASMQKLDPVMIKMAHRIRNELVDGDSLKTRGGSKDTSIVSTKKSRYCSKLYMDKCFKCASKKNLVTHHIVEQHLANKDTGLIDNRYHKNSQFNIMVLCQDCHNLIHSK